MSMKRLWRQLEAETAADDNAVDTIYLLNEQGRLEEVEVEDDAEND